MGQIYICGAFSHHRLVQTLPPPPTPYNVGNVYTLFLQNFNIVLGGGGVRGRGGEATHFETDNRALLKPRFKNTENSCNYTSVPRNFVHHCRCRSRWENLDRGQYPFQPIKFVNLVVPSPCETEPYNNNISLGSYTNLLA